MKHIRQQKYFSYRENEMKKNVHYDSQMVSNSVRDIAMQMFKDNWRPDYIVGITRGGLVPSVILSHMTDIPMHTLCVQLANDTLEENTESNVWMSEHAFGFSDGEYNPTFRKNILIVDDINRGGDAVQWIMNDWQKSCFLPEVDWSDIWHKNVRFASLVECDTSTVQMDYYAEELSDPEHDIWVRFFWET